MVVHRIKSIALRIVLLMCLAASASGMAACGANAEPSATPRLTPTALPTLAPTDTATPLPTPTPEPTQAPTAAPSATPLPTETPAPSPTQPIPTATAQSTPDGIQRTARVPILMYHRITDLPENASASDRDYKIPPAQFEEQLCYLRDNGYQSIRLYDLTRYLQGGDPLPEKAVILTFDDGYRDNAVAAFPLLQKYGFTATFFINTQPINDEYPAYMTWEQVKQLSGAGMDIESHSHSHPNLKGKPADEVLREVRVSKELIEKHTGKEARFFSYPYGHYDQQVVDILAAEGFWGGVTLRAGTTHELSSTFDLERVWVRADDTLESFAVKLQRGW